MTKRVKDDLEKHTVLKQKKGRLNTSARQKHSIDMGTRQKTMTQWTERSIRVK